MSREMNAFIYNDVYNKVLNKCFDKYEFYKNKIDDQEGILQISFKDEYSEIIFLAEDEAEIIMNGLSKYIRRISGMQTAYDDDLCILWIDIHKIPHGYSLNKIKKNIKDEPCGINKLIKIELS